MCASLPRRWPTSSIQTNPHPTTKFCNIQVLQVPSTMCGSTSLHLCFQPGQPVNPRTVPNLKSSYAPPNLKHVTPSHNIKTLNLTLPENLDFSITLSQVKQLPVQNLSRVDKPKPPRSCAIVWQAENPKFWGPKFWFYVFCWLRPIIAKKILPLLLVGFQNNSTDTKQLRKGHFLARYFWDFRQKWAPNSLTGKKWPTSVFWRCMLIFF